MSNAELESRIKTLETELAILKEKFKKFEKIPFLSFQDWTQ